MSETNIKFIDYLPAEINYLMDLIRGNNPNLSLEPTK